MTDTTTELEPIEATVQWGERCYRVRLEPLATSEGAWLGSFGSVTVERDGPYCLARVDIDFARDGRPIHLSSGYQQNLAQAVHVLYERLQALEDWCSTLRASP
jgi:hypothetical protein